jgi:hypothetical protein
MQWWIFLLIALVLNLTAFSLAARRAAKQGIVAAIAFLLSLVFTIMGVISMLRD